MVELLLKAGADTKYQNMVGHHCTVVLELMYISDRSAQRIESVHFYLHLRKKINNQLSIKVGDTAVSAAQDRGHDALALQIARYISKKIARYISKKNS